MELCGININCNHIQDLLKNKDLGKILITVNAEAIVRASKDDKLATIIANNHASIDGQIPFWLYKIKHPNSTIEKISGSDVIYSICKWASQNNYKVFLLGGNEDSNTESVLKLKELYPNLRIEGYSPPYEPYPFSEKNNYHILERIKSFSPEVLFVGFGMGKQEYWAHDNISTLKNMGVSLIIGCGGTFEFVSGKIKRAPKIVQQIGLEGVWRLLQEFKWFRIKRLLLSFGIFYYFFFPKKTQNRNVTVS